MTRLTRMTRRHVGGAQTTEIVGRTEELAALERFLDDASVAPAALVLEGDPGVGKSTLWDWVVHQAGAGGYHVLTSRPAEAERGLAHVGLGDLLDDVGEDRLAALAAPRRRALEIALLRDEAAGDPVDPRALALGVRDVLRLLSDRLPTLLAVDDVQWLDPSSAAALAFALRRLGTHQVLVLLARRPTVEDRRSPLEDALPPERLSRVTVGPLSAGALHRLLLLRLETPFARQTLLRIHEQSAGNAFFALELARVVGSRSDPLEPLPVPDTIDELLRARILGLPEATVDALGLVAALGAASRSMLERTGVTTSILEPATAAQVVVVESSAGAVRFTHPAFASVLYHDLGERRRSVHARIAEVADDPLVRARHLALSREEPDAGTAAALDRAAALAVDRGASALAAELSEHAARLTPPSSPDERALRVLAAALAHQTAGEWPRARALAGELLRDTDAPARRVEALLLLAELESVDRGALLLERALVEAGGDPRLQSVIHCRLAWARRFTSGTSHARAALAIADRLDDDELRADAGSVQTILGWFLGEGPGTSDLPALARRLPRALGGDRLVQEATQAIVNTFAPVSTRDEARSLLEREHREWRERDEPRSARALWGLAWVEFWAGRWERAADHAAEAHDIAIQYGLEVPQDRLPSAVVALHRGELELARMHSERALELAEEQLGFHPPQHVAVLGLVALGEGDAERAAERLARAGRQAATLGWGEPSVRWWTGDQAELLLVLGRLDEADSLVTAWEHDALRVGRPWVLAHVTRCRGLAAAARGDVGEALDRLAHAAAEHDAVGDPFGCARALLALGTVRRRARQKRPAREALEQALDGFESIGGARWAARARAELGRIGGRVRAEGLTPAEARVALLAVEGRTNREIAASLFLGERTVASHLTHIYAKLGVRSRTELAGKLHAGESA